VVGVGSGQTVETMNHEQQWRNWVCSKSKGRKKRGLMEGTTGSARQTTSMMARHSSKGACRRVNGRHRPPINGLESP
jgi:hypothetical protein